MRKFITKNAMALVALAIAAVTLMSFGINKKAEETLYFMYQPPTSDPLNPYSQANVENLAHWIKTDEPCKTSGDVSACTIEVSELNTINGDGIELDGAKVEIKSSFKVGNPTIFKVDAPTSTEGKGYDNPVNAPAPQ